MEKLKSGFQNMRSSIPSRWLQAMFILGIFVIFTLVFFPVYQILGPTVGAFIAIPMLIASWILGLWGGLLVGLLAIPFVMLLYAFVDYTSLVSWPGFLVALIMSAAVGLMRDLSKRLRREISERKRAEDARDRLFDLPSILIMVAGPDGMIKNVSSGWQDVLGYSADEMVGKYFFDFIHSDDMPESKEGTEQVAGGETVQYFENRYRHKDGVYRTLAWSASADPGTGLNYGVAQDITERKQAEYQVRKHGAVLEAINRVFLETLTCESEEDVAATCLAVAEELTGSKFGIIGELNQVGLFDTYAISNPGWDACKMPGSEATRVIKNMEIRGIDRSVLRDGESRIVNEPASHPDSIGTPEGHPPITSFLGVPLKMSGKTIGMIGLGNKASGYDQDDQEAVETLAVAFVEALMRKRREEMIESYSARLERSNRDLQDFAYVASHDLQEPLRKVIAFGDRLVADYEEALDETGRDYLERMRDASKRMQTLISDLLAFSRVTTKGKPFTPVDLSIVAQDVVSDLEYRIEQTGGQVAIDPLPMVEADPTQMHQLLQNLVGNALKFHQADRQPVIKISGNSGDDRTCRIIVDDNGIGFEPKFTERIFQPFQRLHLRREYEGSGMGLAICRRIAERHGGDITAKSTPGEGATFIVTLPLQQQTGEHGHG